MQPSEMEPARLVLTARRSGLGFNQAEFCSYLREFMQKRQKRGQTTVLSELTVVCSWLFTTGEHLDAYSDGGIVSHENIVAVCWFCNSRRHRSRYPKAPLLYKQYVQTRVSKGQWNSCF